MRSLAGNSTQTVSASSEGVVHTTESFRESLVGGGGAGAVGSGGVGSVDFLESHAVRSATREKAAKIGLRIGFTERVRFLRGVPQSRSVSDRFPADADTTPDRKHFPKHESCPGIHDRRWCAS